MTNYLITNEQEYVGNHIYNYLREYLFNHINEFYVFQSINDIPYKNNSDNIKRYYKLINEEYKDNLLIKHENLNEKIENDDTFEREPYEIIECYETYIKYKDKVINFPIPYGQYYCFYDETQLNYFNNLSNETQKETQKETCYILDLCECVLKQFIKNEPYKLKIEKNSKLSNEKDRLNKDSKFIFARSGFSDNIHYYSILVNYYTNYYLVVSSLCKNLEIKQKNNNMLKFKCYKIVTKDSLTNKCMKNAITNYYIEYWNDMYAYIYDNYRKFITNYNTKEILLNSIAKYSYKIMFDEYSLLGIRCVYPVLYTVTESSHSFIQLKYHIDSIIKFLETHNNIVLMIDDWRFLNFILTIFYDILLDKKIQILINIRTNDVHELIKIGYNSKEFLHTYSGFYTIIDNIKNNYNNCSKYNTQLRDLFI